jgi:hypothetical protein
MVVSGVTVVSGLAVARTSRARLHRHGRLGSDMSTLLTGIVDSTVGLGWVRVMDAVELRFGITFEISDIDLHRATIDSLLSHLAQLDL